MLVAAGVSIYSGNVRIGLISSLIIFISVFILWIWNRFKRMIKLMLSTNGGYYYSFELEENVRVWQEVKKSFCYLGVSADSIMEPLRRWIAGQPSLHYKILLMKPDSQSLLKQEAFEMGYPLDAKTESLTAAEQRSIQKAAKATSIRIKSAVALFESMPVFKEGHLEVRLYDEFTPWWAYVIDDHKAYIGILETGLRGNRSPVIIMRKNIQYTSPFDAFHNNWNRIWEDAIDIRTKHRKP